MAYRSISVEQFEFLENRPLPLEHTMATTLDPDFDEFDATNRCDELTAVEIDFNGAILHLHWEH